MYQCLDVYPRFLVIRSPPLPNNNDLSTELLHLSATDDSASSTESVKENMKISNENILITVGQEPFPSRLVK